MEKQSMFNDLFQKHPSTSTIGFEDVRFETFMKLYLGFVCLYAFMMAFFYTVSPILFPKKLGKATHYEKVGFAATIVSTINDVLAVAMATYTVMYMCDYPLAIFYGDKECMGTHRNFYSYAITWSIGYFTYDFFMMCFVFEWGGSYFLQSMFHHVLASSFGILVVRYGGRSIPICY
jgi:hypothetical protein